MKKHPVIETVVGRIHKDVIGGAADTAIEAVHALKELISDSQAPEMPRLADQVEDAVDDILEVLPSLAPPVNALHMIMHQVDEGRNQEKSLGELKSALLNEMENFLEDAEAALDKVAQYGAEKITDGSTIFMYSMSSTVWRILKKAKNDGKEIAVSVTESRPANEGLWTVEKMEEYGIPVTVGIDAAMGILIPEADMVMVGADVIAATGEALCKVGTYPSALVAQQNNIPFYIAADTYKFDVNTLMGLPFRIEDTKRKDVLPEGKYKDAKVHSPLFDVTPPELITAIITERGFLHPASVSAWMQEMPISESLQEKLFSWSKESMPSDRE